DARTLAAGARENEAWHRFADLEVKEAKAGWEKFRDQRVKALRESLGTFPDTPAAIKVHVTRTIRGEGYRIENVVYKTRPGLFVTANLYMPGNPSKSMPGILLSHSHH